MATDLGLPAQWHAMAGTPLAEIRRRARAVEVLDDIAPTAAEGADRFAWNDGSGQCAVWYFLPDGRALLLTYDHECALNVYDLDDDYRIQRSFYDGLPDELVALVVDQPANYETLNCVHGGEGHTVYTAGGVFWFDGTAWAPAPGLLDHCATQGIDLFTESGFAYCTGPYLFGTDFTAESVVARKAYDGLYADDAEQAAAVSDTAAKLASLA